MNVLTAIQAQLLNFVYAASRQRDSRRAPETSPERLTGLLGGDVVRALAGKTVIDFGCGEGADALEMAVLGARRVIGIDNREEVLAIARGRAAAAGLERVCSFATSTRESADFIVSVDAFEHFDDPWGVLLAMDELLKPDGEIVVSFGYPWLHPLGGHLFSVFPWAHVLLSEKALIQWRSQFRFDGATRFEEVSGGLNRMTIRRFENIVHQSPFEAATFELIPSPKLRLLHTRLTREFTTAVIRCRLRRKQPEPQVGEHTYSYLSATTG